MLLKFNQNESGKSAEETFLILACANISNIFIIFNALDF